MMLSVSVSPPGRSRLEEMLDSLLQKDEKQEKRKDSPPALPPRPTSKARLPPARRSLPNNFKVSSDRGAEEYLPNGFDAKEESKRKENELGLVQKRSSCFGRKRVKMDVESPYMVRSQENLSLLTSTASSGKIGNLENDSISYFIKKVVAESVNKEKKIKVSGDEEESKMAEQTSNKNTKANTSKTNKETFGESSKENSKDSEVQKPDYIHVRARRGQATDSPSLSERVRREKISGRMKYLQDLVPGCNKITGKAGMLEEIINYVQSLQRQVERSKYMYLYLYVWIKYVAHYL